MKIFKKAGQPQPTKLQKRISGIGTYELVAWAENALYVIGKEITHAQRTRDELALDEAILGAEALLEITKELKKRASNER
jgi:hypothetical protein